MLGWEFPPYSTGGLGTACHGLTKGLAKNDVEITFIMPKGPDSATASHVNLVVANNVIKTKIKFKKVDSALVPYISSESYIKRLFKLKKGSAEGSLYGSDLFQEVHRFAEKVRMIAED